MTDRDVSSVGAPCWVDTFQPDTAAARDFYGPLFGWSFDAPVPDSSGTEDRYFTARRDGRLVAGIGQGADAGPAVWRTYVRVADLENTLARVESAGGSQRSGPLSVEDHGRLAG